MAYQVSSQRVVFYWLASEPSAERRDSFLTWLPDLADDPYRDALPVPGRSPVHARPVPGCRLAVTYPVAEQFKAVHVISIDDL